MPQTIPGFDPVTFAIPIILGGDDTPPLTDQFPGSFPVPTGGSCPPGTVQVGTAGRPPRPVCQPVSGLPSEPAQPTTADPPPPPPGPPIGGSTPLFPVPESPPPAAPPISQPARPGDVPFAAIGGLITWQGAGKLPPPKIDKNAETYQRQRAKAAKPIDYNEIKKPPPKPKKLGLLRTLAKPGLLGWLGIVASIGGLGLEAYRQRQAAQEKARKVTQAAEARDRKKREAAQRKENARRRRRIVPPIPAGGPSPRARRGRVVIPGFDPRPFGTVRPPGKARRRAAKPRVERLGQVRITSRRVPGVPLGPYTVTAPRATPPAPRPRSPAAPRRPALNLQQLLPLLGVLTRGRPGGGTVNLTLPNATGVPSAPGVPATQPLIGPIAFAPPGGSRGTPTKSKSCDCGPKKKRKPRVPRSVCYRGTYIETAKGLSKSRKEAVPCQ